MFRFCLNPLHSKWDNETTKMLSIGSGPLGLDYAAIQLGFDEDNDEELIALFHAAVRLMFSTGMSIDNTSKYLNALSDIEAIRLNSSKLYD